MTLTEHISTFLRDAQFRIATIGIELNEMGKQNREYDKLWMLRNDLCQFVGMLYNARFSFKDAAYRFLDWTDAEIIKEIEHQRWVSGVNEIPYLTFTAYYPWLVNNVVNSNGTSIGFPNGNLGQYLVYTLNNQVEAQDFPTRCGMELGEDINDYFAGRL